MPVEFTEERVRVGDAIQLRSPAGLLDAQITGIELIKRSSGPCHVGFLLPLEIGKSQIMPDAEIWLENQSSPRQPFRLRFGGGPARGILINRV